MKKLSFALFAALVSANLGAQHFPQDWLKTVEHHEWEAAYYSFEGEVKQCKLFSNEVLKNEWTFAQGKGLEKLLSYEGDKIIYSADYTYNVKNLPIEAKSVYNFETEGELFQRGFEPQNSVVRFTFDQNGKLIEKLKNNVYKTVYDYDKRGFLTGIAHCTGANVNSTENYTYDNDGRLLKHLGFQCPHTGNCDLYSTIEYTYGNYGVDRERNKSTYILQERAYSYDEHGRLVLVKLQTTISSRFTESSTAYAYNDKGQLIKVEFLCEGSGTIYEYEYDEHGNWIKELYSLFKETGEKTLQTDSRREFVYF